MRKINFIGTVNIGFMLALTSCSSFDGVRCFSLDGKASLSCKRGLRSERVCANHGGLKTYNYYSAICNDGTEFEKP